MKISEIPSYAISKITNATDRLPVFIFGGTIGVGVVQQVAIWLMNIAHSYELWKLFSTLMIVLSLLSLAASLALAAYLVLWAVKGKRLTHIVAAAAYVLSIFLSFVQLGLLSSLATAVFVVSLCLPSLRGSDPKAKSVAVYALILQAAGWLMSLLQSWFYSGFVYEVCGLLCMIVGYVRCGLLLLVVLYDVEQFGGVRLDLSSINRMSDPEPAFCPSAAPVESDTTAWCDGVIVPPVVPASGGCRYQYKTVAGPVGLTIERRESYADAVKQYASILDREAVGGWRLDSIQEIPVTKKAGCLGSLLGQADVTVFFNMLIFRKDD